MLYKSSHDNETRKLTETQNNLAKTSATLRECQRSILCWIFNGLFINSVLVAFTVVI